MIIMIIFVKIYDFDTYFINLQYLSQILIIFYDFLRVLKGFNRALIRLALTGPNQS